MSKHSNIQSKIYSSVALQKALSVWRLKNDTVVFTNGCFDLIHLGHIDYLSRAANLGDRLIIGLNTDNSVSKLKGKHRPIKDEHSRATILASFSFIDAVVLFEEDTPLILIEEIKPDILVKGGDYKAKEIVGYKSVKDNKGEVVVLDFIEGYSSTLIEEKIKTGIKY
jgi:rfaE bifunctional protein nucleotidyltransferase chain/domain